MEDPAEVAVAACSHDSATEAGLMIVMNFHSSPVLHSNRLEIAIRRHIGAGDGRCCRAKIATNNAYSCQVTELPAQMATGTVLRVNAEPKTEPTRWCSRMCSE